MDRRVAHEPPHPAQQAQEIRDLFPRCLLLSFPAVPHTCGVQVAIREFRAQLRHLLGRAAADRGMKHGRKRNILPGVVADLQVIQYGLHFQREKISRSGGAVRRNPLRAQHAHEALRPP